LLVHDSSKEATELAKKNPKFPWGLKLEAFTVRFHMIIKYNLQQQQWGWEYIDSFPQTELPGRL
jgi:hypothetical protein